MKEPAATGCETWHFAEMEPAVSACATLAV